MKDKTNMGITQHDSNVETAINIKNINGNTQILFDIKSYKSLINVEFNFQCLMHATKVQLVAGRIVSW